MIFYQLDIAPGDADGEGEDHSKWFTRLAFAQAVRRDLIARDPYGEDEKYPDAWKITRYEVSGDLSPKTLLLAILNRKGWAAEVTEVVPAYVFPPKPEEPDEDEGEGEDYPHPSDRHVRSNVLK